MRNLARALSLVVALTLGSCGSTTSNEAPGSNDVTIHILTMGTSNSYTQGVSVKLGGRVFFVADLSGHSATSDTGPGTVFNTGILSSGQQYIWTPTSAGTFGFHCSAHPTMTGSVTVNP